MIDKIIKELNFAITICNKEGIITYMNDKAIQTFESDGGEKLLGTNVLDCHPEPSRTQLADMLKNEIKNVYTIEKNGIKKLIYQSPYYEKGEYMGFIELSLEVPNELQNFIRK